MGWMNSVALGAMASVSIAALASPGLAAAQTSSAPEAAPAPRVTFDRGQGMEIESADGQHAVRMSLRGQGRATVEAPHAREPAVGFTIPRARLNLSGRVFGYENHFKVQLAFSPTDLGVRDGLVTRTPLLDYVFELRHLRDLILRVGQYKLPLNRERIMSSGALSFVDRSLVDAELGMDRDLAVEVRSSNLFGLGRLRYHLGIGSGEGRDGGVGTNAGLTYFGRVEVLPLGSFRDHQEPDLARHAQPRLSLGFAFAFVDDAARSQGLRGDPFSDGGTTDQQLYCADLLFFARGLSAQLEVLYTDGHRSPGGALDEAGAPLPVSPPRRGLGALARLGWLLPDVPIELGARFAITQTFVAPEETALPERREVTGALSWYASGHALKLQLDVGHLWTGDGPLDEGTTRVRLQLDATL